MMTHTLTNKETGKECLFKMVDSTTITVEGPGAECLAKRSWTFSNETETTVAWLQLVTT